jgi:hypothetical protein
LFNWNGVAVVVTVVPEMAAMVNCCVPATCRRIVDALLKVVLPVNTSSSIRWRC